MDDLAEDSKDTKVSPTISQISMLLSGIFMGCVGLFVTLLGKYSIFTIVLLRGIFGTLFLTLFMIKSRSFSLEFLKESIKLHWKPLIISGLMYPFIIYLYFFTIIIYGYAIAAFLLYTNGIFILIFIILSKMDNVSKITIVSFILAIIGVAIIMEFWTSQSQVFSLGLITGLLSGLTLAIFVFFKKVIYNKRNNNQEILKKKGDFDIFLAWWHTLFLILIFLPLGFEDLPKLNLVDLIFALLLGLIPTALAFVLHNVGVKNDKGGNILILAYFEPIVATINTILFLKIFSIYTILGGACILIANALVLKYSSESYYER